MDSLTSSIVRIFSHEERIIGTGVLVTKKYAVTCTHVIYAALNISVDAQTAPTQEILLDFPLIMQKKIFTARVIQWWPVDKEDIAVLELEIDPPSDAQPARLVTSGNLWGHKFQTFGFPNFFDDGIWVSGEIQGVQSSGWVQVESSREGAFKPGFGGSPVWDVQLGGVVGIIDAVERGSSAKLAFMTPISKIAKIWPELSAYFIPSKSRLDNFEHSITSLQEPTTSKDIFVVHGHDESAKEAVARFLEKLGLHPIILHEQPNAGRTVIEKFEVYSNVGFAVVLLTPDDIGTSRASPKQQKFRARQNVVFELGYFVGKLGRERVCALYKEDVEIPSDILGVLFVSMDHGTWRFQLAKEMKVAGIDIDMNKAI